jgi:hypothetical protein
MGKAFGEAAAEAGLLQNLHLHAEEFAILYSPHKQMGHNPSAHSAQYSQVYGPEPESILHRLVSVCAIKYLVSTVGSNWNHQEHFNAPYSIVHAV